MAIKYKDVEYASERISGSVVRHNDVPVYVEHISGGGMAHIRKLASDKGFHEVDYEELDMTPVPLGFVNTIYGVSFARRVPKRRDWRQGLRDIILMVECVLGAPTRIRSTSAELLNTILNIYPSASACVEAIECGEAVGMAFSRVFCVGNKEKEGYALHYRIGHHVGWISIGPDGNINTKLKPEYDYLKEFLQEGLNNG